MTDRFSALSVGVACLLVVGVVPAVLAQATPAPVNPDLPPCSPDWGINTYTAYNVPAFAFNNRGGGQHHYSPDGYLFRSASVQNYFDAPVYLPTGAVVTGLTPFYKDTDPTGDVEFYFRRYTGSSGGGLYGYELLAETSTGTGGYQGAYHALAAPETILNVNPMTGTTNMYVVTIGMMASGVGELGFGGFTVWYRHQISPAPATATFSDVPTGYWAFRHIEALAASGITAGCGGGNYCPESYVKRSEIAVYLAKALGLHWPDATTLP